MEVTILGRTHSIIYLDDSTEPSRIGTPGKSVRMVIVCVV